MIKINDKWEKGERMNIEDIRKFYTAGKRVVLYKMEGEPQMDIGLKGTVKMVDDAGQIHCSWDNGSSLALDPSRDVFDLMPEAEKINVIMCRAGEIAEVAKIEHSLEGLQKAVGGYIEEYFPFQKDPAAIICNENGKLDGLPLNRAVYDKEGNIMDVICGDFLIVGAPYDSTELTDISPKMKKKYLEEFRLPEKFYKAEKGLCGVKYDPRDLDEMEK